MPDENKFAKLREVQYRVRPNCGLCQFGTFALSQWWGSCDIHQYEHAKHDTPDGGRGVSIHIFGVCPDFMLHAPSTAALSNHYEFFDGDQDPRDDGRPTQEADSS